MTEQESAVVSGGDAQTISMDVANGVPPEQSNLTYGPAELAFRERVQAEYDDLLARVPRAAMDVRD